MVTVSQIVTSSIVQLEAGTSAIEAAKLMKTCKVGSVFGEAGEQDHWNRDGTGIVRKVVGTDRLPYYIPVEDIMSSPSLASRSIGPSRKRRISWSRTVPGISPSGEAATWSELVG